MKWFEGAKIRRLLSHAVACFLWRHRPLAEAAMAASTGGDEPMTCQFGGLGEGSDTLWRRLVDHEGWTLQPDSILLL